MPVAREPPELALRAALAMASGAHARRHIGVAVSGGGDSMALLHLTVEWGRQSGVRVAAATVDHGLRPGSAAEAAEVARICAGLGVTHRILCWHGKDRRGNLQQAARQARRELLRRWAAEEGLDHVLLAHTADDQAETFLMRLARGSGVDGLACMRPADADGLFLRPLLAQRRAMLRDWLRSRGIAWIEDPSNEDPRFDRVKARRMLATLAPLGLTVGRLGRTADHMAAARRTLREAAAEKARRWVRQEGGDLRLAPAALDLGRGDTEPRLLAAAVQWIGGGQQRPRLAALEAAAAALRRGEARTLGGVAMLPEAGGGARFMRETAALPPPVTVEALAGTPIRWDGRWIVTRAAGADGSAGQFRLSALGEAGLALCPGWRDSGLKRRSLLATPAVWQGERLVAAPLAGLGAGWSAETDPDFAAFLLSH